MKLILIFNLQRGIDEFSKVPGVLYHNTAGFSNYLRTLIFLLSLAKKSRIISINWHSRWSLCVSSKAYIIGKKETNLKEGVSDTLFMPGFWFQMIFLPTRKRILWYGFNTVSANRVSPHNYKPTIRYVAHIQSDSFLAYNMSKGSPCIPRKNWSGFSSGHFKKRLRKLNSFIKIWMISIFPTLTPKHTVLIKLLH